MVIILSYNIVNYHRTLAQDHNESYYLRAALGFELKNGLHNSNSTCP